MQVDVSFMLDRHQGMVLVLRLMNAQKKDLQLYAIFWSNNESDIIRL